MNALKTLFSLLMLLTLAACGGGGGSAGTPLNGGGSGNSPTVSDLVIVLSAATVANNGVDSITATISAVDANRNAMADVPVTVSVNNNAIAVPSGTKTDNTGKITAQVAIGSDISARTITVTAQSGTLTKTANFSVVGSTPGAVVTDLVVTLSAPSILASSNDPVTATVVAVDANRSAVANVPVTVSVNNNAFSVPSGTKTDAAGRITAQVSVGADKSPRTITVVAQSGSLVRTASFNVVLANTGAVASDLVLTLSAASVANSGAETVIATVTAVDSNRNAVPDAPVTVSVNNNAIAVPSATKTDSTGKITAQVAIGSDRATRTITVTAQSGTLVKNATFNVISTSPFVVASDLVLTLSASTVSNSGAETVTATVTAVDANRNALANVPVLFTVNNNAIAAPAATSTGTDGKLAAVIGIGADRSTRTVVVTASSGSISRTANLTVTQPVSNIVASDVVLVLSASAVNNSGTGTVVATATALDANRNSLAGAPLVISADANAVVTPSGATTDGNGNVTASVGIGSDRSARSITVTARSGLITKTAQLQVTSNPVTSLPTLEMALSSSTVSAATPATVTATLRDPSGQAISGQVVTFSVVRSLAATNVKTALTDSAGRAVVVLAPTTSTGAGADEVVANATSNGVALSATRGFQVTATNVTIDSFSSAVGSLGAYGQTSLTLNLTGVSIGTPVQVGITSACASLNKAVVSPTNFSATASVVTIQYRDVGCGAVQASDSLQATIIGTAAARSLSLPISAPAVSSLAFIQSSPETIYLKGSGFAEASLVTFEVRDAAGNPLPNRNVVIRLLTLTGGVTMEGGTADVTRTSDAQGRVVIRVNSGTLPTPVRLSATLEGTAISTVSSNLSIAVGLPSQLNFSMSQEARNIEGFNLDGTPNTYTIIAADRSGNPVPAGTSINFVAEGGQVEAIKQTALVSGIARTTANFVSAEPRPLDGRVTITSYALGEESFIDLNGNNTKDAGEPFQDLGNIFKDRLFDGVFDPSSDEFIPLAINNSSACGAITDPLLNLDATIPSMPATCDGVWSGAGRVYVRRAAETVLSTSAARPLWASTGGNGVGLDNSCRSITLQVAPDVTRLASFKLVGGDTWYGGSAGGLLSFIVADANPGRRNPATGQFEATPAFPYPRLNPMAAGTTISAVALTDGLKVLVGGGSPVPSTTEASVGSVGYSFTDANVSSGVLVVSFRSPVSGTVTSVSVSVLRQSLTDAGRTACN